MGIVDNLISDTTEENGIPSKSELAKLSKEELINKCIEISRYKNLQEDLLLNVSHDLRSPLSVILSVLQCYESGYVDENNKSKMKQYMKNIKRNSYKMLKLINNLIDTTRLEKDYYKIERRNLDIVKLIENTIASIDRYAKQKNISLVFDTNVEQCIMAVDAQALDRIIMNLISNAIKFSFENSSIYINLLKCCNELVISVKDEGIGIPEKDQNKIFNRFIQSTSKKQYEHCGSGIGLSLVENLTKAHGGSIELNSIENRGSEFIIKLPIIKVSENIVDKNISNCNKNNVQMLEIEFSDIYL
ncbi:hypothetical protein UT300005_28280 [Clostridium sp. CTA-5]